MITQEKTNPIQWYQHGYRGAMKEASTYDSLEALFNVAILLIYDSPMEQTLPEAVRPLPHSYSEQIWQPQWMGAMGTQAVTVRPAIYLSLISYMYIEAAGSVQLSTFFDTIKKWIRIVHNNANDTHKSERCVYRVETRGWAQGVFRICKGSTLQFVLNNLFRQQRVV